jgi:nitroreductase
MQKPAETQYPIHELIRHRWSPRAFSNRLVEPEKLLSILEAARWAPSCFNEQPWSFVLATRENPTEYEHLASCLSESNQRWAPKAPVLMLSVAKLFFEKSEKENRLAFHDVGLAVENLIIQAMSLGLIVHQMGGFSVEKARELCGVPERYQPVAMIAIGYAGDPEVLPEDLQQKEWAPRGRKLLSEFVFAGRWGQIASMVKD